MNAIETLHTVMSLPVCEEYVIAKFGVVLNINAQKHFRHHEHFINVIVV